MVLKFDLGALATNRSFAITRAVEHVMRAELGQGANVNLAQSSRQHGCESALRDAAREVAGKLLAQRMTMQRYLALPRALQPKNLTDAIEEFNEIMADFMHVHGHGTGHLLLSRMDDVLGPQMGHDATKQLRLG